jgi:hypothetical protein
MVDICSLHAADDFTFMIIAIGRMGKTASIVITVPQDF